ncbi:ATP-binding cassette domain-containing protein [Methylophilus sp. 13]|uniref:ABC transporter ATP-binding protein n=1 Tax=Methylophilus sp. 13 TaxID=2781018 RepID=UPI00188DC7AA|nr:polysaccharide ABC transporter ATP-binding protein [Methylophilus sp. 13]MBF5038117.1 ATP-binding cassette domain-containing protein [Methylophilus sp. 13]
MSPVIKVENISKSYLINHNQSDRYKTVRDEITHGMGRFYSRLKNPLQKSSTSEVFWALKDISFSINAGECIGVIGRNGAGKSTLLKTLSRITKPTSGKITLVGKLGCLLEVGTGFHPELTGRENIYLNGAILGMGRNEIKMKFDEIVEFSEIERFLDTPVKRYSSGMYVRLAFSVAAHLEPELLILDEVLAVGDQKFQQKCFDQIRRLGRDSGRAVMLVSHNMAAISRICNRSLLLESGRLIADGPTQEVLEKYATQSNTTELGTRVMLDSWENREGKRDIAQITWVQILAHDSDYSMIYVGSNLLIRFAVNFDKQLKGNDITLAVQLSTISGYQIANMLATDSNYIPNSMKGECVFEVMLEDIRFYPGEYLISLWVGNASSEPYDYVLECGRFEVHEGGAKALRRLPRVEGMHFLTPKWQLL